MLRLTLTRRIAIAAAMLTLLMVSLVGGVAFWILRGQVMDTMHHSLEYSAGDVARLLETRLSAFADNLGTLAANSLVGNALVDNEGRKRYLDSFLDGYTTIAGVPVSLAVTDYQGEILTNPITGKQAFDPKWVAERVATDSAAATLVDTAGSRWLVMAEPVIFANTAQPEGALVLQVDMRSLMAMPSEFAHFGEWQHSAHISLHVTDGGHLSEAFQAGLPQPANGVSIHDALSLAPVYRPLRFDLEVISDPHSFNAPLRRLLIASAAVAVLAVLAVGLASIVLGRALTRRLRALEDVARHVSLEDSEHRRLPVSGNDEVTGLTVSFNRLLDRLQMAFDELTAKSVSLEQALGEAREARTASEHANQAKSLFLANMSHELRTPLNAILGFAQLLERDPAVGAEQRKSLLTIYRSGQHLLSLINDVLEISRIEAGRMDLDEAPIDLHELLLAVTEVIRLRAEEKGLELRLEQAAEVPHYIEADQRKLRQMLINLLGNAVKFTDAGWVRLGVALEDERLVFEVADSGVGISADDIQRIFQPFYQSSGAHRSEGTGLGLAITHEYAQMMGGELSVDSTLGEGTRFRIVLPYRPAAAKAVIGGTAERQVVGLLPDQPAYRVLVADDKTEGRELLMHLLQGAGFEVRGAENGALALECFESWQPQLVWMDMRMPVMDGYEATRRIKASPQGRDTVVIALTASAFEEDRHKVLAAGCDDFMRKPINADQVFEMMARHLGVGYRYAPAGTVSEPVLRRPAHLPEALAALPSTLRTALGAAAEALDVAAAREVIEAIGEYDPALGEYLADLAAGYRYDELARLGADVNKNEKKTGMTHE